MKDIKLPYGRGMIPAHSIEEAIDMADEILLEAGKKDPKITVIPDGVSVIVQAED